MGESGKVLFKSHHLWSSHKLIKIVELECQWYIISDYCLCWKPICSGITTQQHCWAMMCYPQRVITFSTSWMCSCLSASVIRSTYHLSTLMRSLKYRGNVQKVQLVSLSIRSQQIKCLFLSQGGIIFHQFSCFCQTVMIILQSLHITIITPFLKLKRETFPPSEIPFNLDIFHEPCCFWPCFQRVNTNIRRKDSSQGSVWIWLPWSISDNC